MTRLAEYLVGMTKESIEVHSHGPASSDVAEPGVKKKSLSKSSALVFPGAPGRAISAATRGLSSPTNPGTAWLRRSTTKPEHHTKPEGPETRQMSAFTQEQRTTQAAGGSHIVRPAV